MNWQWLWLGFLLLMTVSGQTLGPSGKEAAVVSSPHPSRGKRDQGLGRDRGTAPQSHPGLHPELQRASPFLPLLYDLFWPISHSLPLFYLSPFPKVPLSFNPSMSVLPYPYGSVRSFTLRLTPFLFCLP